MLREDVLAWLYSVAPMYPRGVPVEAFKRAAKRDALEVVFITDPLPAKGSPEMSLLENAVQKGMNLPLASMRVVSKGKNLPSCKAAVLLDPTPGRSAWRIIEGKPVMATHSLSAVCADQRKKREFWEDLKLVMEKIK